MNVQISNNKRLELTGFANHCHINNGNFNEYNTNILHFEKRGKIINYLKNLDTIIVIYVSKNI